MPNVERRRHPRVKPQERISVFVLGEGHPYLSGQVLDMSSKGLGIRVPKHLPPGSPIKIELGDELLLGEVAHCTPENGEYRVGLAVRYRLRGMAGLHRLNRSLNSTTRTPEGTVSLIMKK